MTDEKLSFLREDNGRFAPKEAQEEPTPQAPEPAPNPEPPQAAVPTPPAPATGEPAPIAPNHAVPPGYVPIAATLDERDKRQAIQREFDELKRKYEEATRKPPVEIDPVTDPDGFRTHQEQQLARSEWNTLTRISKVWAERAHGKDAVTAAEEAIKTEVERNPGFFNEIQRQSDPYDFAVQWHKRQAALAKIGDKDPEAWAEEWARQKGYVLNQPNGEGVAPVAPAPATPTPLPRPSLASAPAAGGSTPKVATGPGAAFGGVFSK